jgi:hypothetical protein
MYSNKNSIFCISVFFHVSHVWIPAHPDNPYAPPVRSGHVTPLSPHPKRQNRKNGKIALNIAFVFDRFYIYVSLFSRGGSGGGKTD